MGVFSTYMVMENVRNPADLKVSDSPLALTVTFVTACNCFKQALLHTLYVRAYCDSVSTRRSSSLNTCGSLRLQCNA
jgi:hypothetical protein